MSAIVFSTSSRRSSCSAMNFGGFGNGIRFGLDRAGVADVGVAGAGVATDDVAADDVKTAATIELSAADDDPAPTNELYDVGGDIRILLFGGLVTSGERIRTRFLTVNLLTSSVILSHIIFIFVLQCETYPQILLTTHSRSVKATSSEPSNLAYASCDIVAARLADSPFGS
jgi:hypothetical protein